MSESEKEFLESLASYGITDVGKDVAFPWGAKSTIINGKPKLQAMGPHEYLEIVNRKHKLNLSIDDVLTPRCIRANNTCASQGCPGYCLTEREIGDDGVGYWYCICSY